MTSAGERVAGRQDQVIAGNDGDHVTHFRQ